MSEITENLRAQLPEAARGVLAEQSEKIQNAFAQEYERRRRKVRNTYLLLLFLPGLHFFQLGFSFLRLVLSVFFLFTIGGLFLWWLLEWILAPRRIRKHNENLAMDVLKDVKSLYSPAG
ncbi:MAG: hypothetical protein ACOC0L_01055 [bacterium]